MCDREKAPALSRWRGGWTWIAVLAVLLFAFTMITVFWIARYNVPCADDFSYGRWTHRAWTETHSVFRVLGEAGRQVRQSYFGWQGTYAAVFIMSLQPAVFSESAYWLCTPILLLSLLGGLLFFLLEVFVGMGKKPRSVCMTVWACLSVILVQYLPYPVEGLYWFNGSVFYTFFFGLLLFSAGMAARYIRRGGWGRLVVLCLLMAALGGGSYPVALLTAELWVLTEAGLIRRKNRRWKELLIPALILLAGFIVSVTAPGNDVRQANYTDRPGAVGAVYQSLYQMVILADRWMDLRLAAMLLLMAPALWKLTEKASISFRQPLAVSALSYGLVSSVLTPVMYATGSTGPGRYLNVAFYFMALAIAGNMWYWMGYIRTRFFGEAGEKKDAPILFLAAMLAVVVGCNHILDTSSPATFLSAWRSLYTEDAASYSETFRQRLEILGDEEIRDAVLPDYPVRPKVLYFDDITEDAGDWRNKHVAEYYGKDTVVRELN